ncbi:MAG: hypothetical protein V3U80_00395 [Flavobacteriaceae bacterium]
MKTTTYKLIIVLLLLPIIGYSNGPKGKYNKSKTIEKSFNVDSNTDLIINNRYGNVDITTWDKNTIEISVKITVNGNNKEKVLSKLKAIDVDFTNNKTQVTATTIISKKTKGFFSSSWFSNASSLSFKINYTVKMPITNSLDVSNDYGSIAIDELEGKASIHCDYGRLFIGSLLHSKNSINMNYTSNSTIEFMESGELNANYSGLSIAEVTNLIIDADYSNFEIDKVKDLSFDCDYGGLKVGSAEKVNGEADYFSMKFNSIYTNFDLNLEYGSIKINSLKKDFKVVNIDADYSGVKIGFDEDASCNINLSLEYGGFKFNGDKFNFNKQRNTSSSKHFSGYFNKSNNNSILTINSEYGNVKFNQIK